MTKKELIEWISKDTGFKKADVEKTLDSMGGVYAAELIAGGEVPLPGLGKLKAEDRKARMGRNPRTGVPLKIEACTVVKFAIGSELKDALR